MTDASREPPFCEEPYVAPVNGKVQPPTFRLGDSSGRHTNLLQYLHDNLVNEIWQHRSAWPFRVPVDAAKLKLPDYHQIIRYPMDLRTIKRRLENRYYWSAKFCLDDFQTIFRNCYTYNRPGEDVVVMARELEIVFLTKVAEMPREEVEIVESRPSASAVSSSSSTIGDAVGSFPTTDTQASSTITAGDTRSSNSPPLQAVAAAAAAAAESGAAPLPATTSSSTNNYYYCYQVAAPSVTAASFLRHPVNLCDSDIPPSQSRPAENPTGNVQSLSDIDVACLRCSTCQRYLSYAPITVDVKGASKCGRCPSAGKSLARNKTYETLANYFVFSCIFDFLGCTRKIKFCDVPGHEAACGFRVEPCPVGNCQAIACLNKMRAHFVKHHSHLVGEDSRFQIPREVDVSVSSILNLDGQNVLLQMRPTCITPTAVKWDVAFAFFNQDPDADSYKYSLKIFSSAAGANKSFKMDLHPIGVYQPLWNYPKQNIASLDLNALQALLGCEELAFELLVDKSLRLECDICTESMDPPIYICKTGHSVCGSCKNKVAVCPTCRAKFEGTRNYQLEVLACRMSQFRCLLVDKQK